MNNQLKCPEDVITKIAHEHGVSVGSVYSHSRKREVVNARKAIVKVLKDEWKMSFAAIGGKLEKTRAGIRHHYFNSEQKPSFQRPD